MVLLTVSDPMFFWGIYLLGGVRLLQGEGESAYWGGEKSSLPTSGGEGRGEGSLPPEGVSPGDPW